MPTKCDLQLKQRMTSAGMDEGLAQMIVDGIPVSQMDDSVKAFQAGRAKGNAAVEMMKAVDALARGNEKTLARDFGNVAASLKEIGIDPHDLIRFDADGKTALGWKKRYKESPIDTLYSAVAERIAGVSGAFQNKFFRQAGFTELAEWVRKATPEDAKGVVKQLYKAFNDGDNVDVKSLTGQARNITEMHLNNVRTMVSRGVDPSAYKFGLLPPMPISAGKLAKMSFTDFKATITPMVDENIKKRIALAGYTADNYDDGLEKWLKEAHIFHATGKSAHPNNPHSFYAISPTSYEQWDKMVAELGDEKNLAGQILNSYVSRTMGFALQGAGADVLGYGYSRLARQIEPRIGGEGRGGVIKENVRVARLYRALGGTERSAGLYNPGLGKALDTATEPADDVVKSYVDNIADISLRGTSGVLRNSTALIRPVTLAMTPWLMATDSALRGFTIGNKYGSSIGAVADFVSSVGNFFNLYAQSIGGVKSGGLRVSQAEFDKFRLASRTAMHVAQEFATRFSDDVFMNQTWNQVTKGVGDLLGYNSANNAALLAARVRIDNHARQYAGKSFNQLANSTDVNERLFFSEYLGTQVPSDSWKAYTEVGGDMEALQAANPNAYLDMEASLLYRTQFLSGEQTQLQRFGRLPQEWRGTARGEFANLATMFTSYVINMSEAGARRVYTLNRVANETSGKNSKINSVAGMAYAEAMSVMLAVGAGTIYIKDYALKDRELDWDDEQERNSFIGKSIAYSNAFGLAGDLMRAGLEAASNYDSEEKFWARAIGDRVPGVGLMGGIIGDMAGLVIEGVQAFYEGRVDKDAEKAIMRDVTGLTRTLIPFNRHFLTTPILNNIATDAWKRTIPGQVLTDRPR